MGLLTIDDAESILNKIKIAKRIVAENSRSAEMCANTFCAYEFSYDSVHKDQVRHIALVQPENEEGVLIYVNQLSIHKFSYFDFFDNEAWVEKKYAKRSNSTFHSQLSGSLLDKLASLRPKKNNVLLLRLKTTHDFRTFLLWYAGCSYSQDEIEKILLNYCYDLPNSPFEIHRPSLINKKLLKRNGLLKYFKTLFETNNTPFLHRKYIKEIIGDAQETIFFDTEKSTYFKVLSLFKFLSMANDKWFRLICKNMKYPSLSNNPVALKYDGFIDNESIHMHETKRMKDAILRFFYNRLRQSACIKQPHLESILLSDNECFTKFDIQLSYFDTYIQKLFDLYVAVKPSYQNGDIFAAIDEATLDVRLGVHKLLKTYDSEINLLTNDDLVLTLIKCASINRAANDCDFILNIYSDIEKCIDNYIPGRIDLIKHIQDESKIIDVLLNIFDIEEHEIPEDICECAKMVNKMLSIYYDLDATPEDRRKFEEKMLSPAYVGVSAALLLNGYIKSNIFGSRKKCINDFKIRIRGEQNYGINTYNWLSGAVKVSANNEKMLKGIMYCMPDDLYKFLTVRYSIVLGGMKSQQSIKEAAVDALKLKRRKIEIQKEIIESFKDYNIEYIYDFICFFRDHVLDFEKRIIAMLA
ncbi:hypothetical protein [Methylomonas koyamae]|uniref:hypothetical protein n=1 Tax=Methylomonas koyamae TaxID=702114 RepID=UPI000BC2E2E6|nr:hypothetical protein [Methylomonas koyamae]ATG88325.1 hypothetical protein MKLM6_0036 [Methylomonas koyamae]